MVVPIFKDIFPLVGAIIDRPLQYKRAMTRIKKTALWAVGKYIF